MVLPSLNRAQADTGVPPVGESWFDSGPTRVLHPDECASRFSGRMGPAITFLSTCIEVTDLTAVRTLTFELYRELLDTMARLRVPRFVRIWNYIPDINAGTDDAECYRQFCWGRADALGDYHLPAATGIGSKDRWLRISALCTGVADLPASIGVEHLENVRQVSAYNYPRDYGPRSPSFARATLVSPAPSHTGPRPRSLLLVSGTSSIVQHQTMHPGNLPAQIAETVQNIQALFTSLEQDCEPEPLALRFYLRDPTNLATARSSWTANAGHWLAPNWFQADICRADLTMEVEGVFQV